MAQTQRDEAGLPLHATRERQRRHYSRPASHAFTFSGPRISTLFSRERNRPSVTGCYARSIRCFDCCFRTRSFALTTWGGQWWMLCFEKHGSTKPWFSETEIYEPWSSRKCP